jgi:hypothetical protein
MPTLFDPIRKKKVVATPEEKVRQHLIQTLLQNGYPKSHIMVEVDLKKVFPSHVKVPDTKRRADLLCLIPSHETMKPLLIAECKQGRYNQKAAAQAEGYAYVLGMPFFVLADSEKITTFIRQQTLQAYPGIISYEQLIQKVRL